METAVVVCTGNICRSPVGEGALRALLPKSTFDVSSAGTHAVVGSPPEPEVLDFLRRELDESIDRPAQQMTKSIAESADLILTMTEEQRSWVARTAPRSVRRLFTTRELALIVDLLPTDARYAGLRDMAAAASRLRSRLRSSKEPLDIADPYRETQDQYEKSFSAVLDSSRRIAEYVTARVAQPRTGDDE